MSTNYSGVESAVWRWLDEAVIKLNLCPFAHQPRQQNKIKLVCTQAVEPDDILQHLFSELMFLQQTPATDTTLLVLTEALEDFYNYNQFLDECDRLLVNEGLVGEFQIASFHPDYQFAGTEKQDRENFTNRSPYPILHLIREQQLEDEIARYPNVELIPERNIQKLSSLNEQQMRAIFGKQFKR
ncbi:DUF1415 family protein [Neptunicella marina]|uniref:DUF1415 domain-containing protein n=1 Tax=Neptunicella marina TaxID=2125989 RepID=A0A8J6IXF2_9ALTE|nr:DUF1415 domain-containing protein [Neptunicella marina]